jgi:predicted transcriptional regulator
MQDTQENMSRGSLQLSDRKTKELKVLQLHDQGYSYRKIAKEVHLSLREVSKYIHRISSKRKSPSVTSVHDEIILEYRVNGLRHEVRDLESQKEILKNEIKDLRAQFYNVRYQLSAKRSELESVKKKLEYEMFSNDVMKDIFTEDQ